MATVSDPLDRMRYLLARSVNFRVWCGITIGSETEKVAAAFARTYRRFTFDPADLTFPIALVHGTRNESGTRVGGGGGGIWRRFRVRVRFVDEFTGDPDNLVTEVAEFDAFEATVDNILDDMHALSGSGDYLAYDDFAETLSVACTEPENDTPLIVAEYEFTGDLKGSQSE